MAASSTRTDSSDTAAAPARRGVVPIVAGETPLVAVVVLNWNGLADTRDCIRSLFEQSWPAVEIHVVDNASDGGEADRLDEEFGERVRLHRNRANLGFTGGNNTALEKILIEREAKYVALLNNDAVAEPQWLETLVAAAERLPGAGLLASHMVFFDSPDVTENAGTVVLTTGEAVPRGRGRPRSEFTEETALLGACGGAVLYRCDALREVGVFRQDFFANFEDVDLSLRLIATGKQCMFVPGAVVRHRLNRSVDKVRDDEFRVRSVRNLSTAYLINMPWQVVLLNLPWLAASWVLVPIVSPLLGQWDLARILARGRIRTLCEVGSILAERRRFRSMRRGSWLRIWLRQRSFASVYFRFFVDVVLLRRRKYME
jgi:GT2 family glycosyltransferase